MTLSTASNGDVKSEEVQRRGADRVQETCPHVGLPEDPKTWLAFAAEGNCCHYAQPAWPIDPGHQEAFCLSDAYVACPMLEEPKNAPLLPTLRAGDANHRSRGRTLFLIAVAALLLAGTLFAGGWLLGQARGASSPEPSTGMAAETTMEASSTPSATSPPATATHEPAALLAGAEATSTATATPSPPVAATTRPPSTPTATSTVTATPVTAEATVNVDTLNVRNGPGTNYTILGQVFWDESLAIIGRNNGGGWWRICCVSSDEGWVFGETVIAEGDTETVPVVSAPPLPTPTETP